MASESRAVFFQNMPAPLDFIKYMMLPKFHLAIALAAPFVGIVPFTDVCNFATVFSWFKRHVHETPLLLNTFWGFEPPFWLLPNHFVTGPTGLRPSSAMAETSFQALNRWLLDVRRGGLNIVYVSMGTMAKLEKWQVEGVYNGLHALNCAVIWSLKEDQQAHLPVLQADLPTRFFIHKWLPQAEVMLLKEVAVVITHCGWGGLMETMAAGKPIVGTPFFADQHELTAAAVRLGVGVRLLPKHFQASAVQQAVGSVLDDRTFAAEAQKLQRALAATGGATRCCEIIEQCTVHGTAGITTPEPGPFWPGLLVLVLLAVLAFVYYLVSRNYLCF